MTARSAADYLQGRIVAARYRLWADRLDEVARDRRIRNMPLSQRIVQQYARVVRRAALAEEINPEPRP